MNLGQFFSAAGQTSAGIREAEQSERISRQNQLAIEEQNRQADLKQQLAGLQMPSFQPVNAAQYTQQFMPGQAMPMAAPAAPAAPGAPSAPSAARPLPPGVQPSQAGAGRGYVNPPLVGDLKPYENLAGYTPPAGMTGPQNLAALREARMQRFGAPGAAIATVPGATPAPPRQQLGATPPAAPPTAAPPDLSRIYAAVEQVESGGRADAVSPKGAVGPMQTMPGTLKDPGFGVQPAQDNSTEERRRVGQEYLVAMLRKYNGNLDYALAGYNWGPQNTDKWIAAGADPAKLPKETRDYIPKVKAELAGAAPTAGGPPTTLEVPRTQARNMEMAEFYLAQPESIPYEMQQLNQMAQQQSALLTQQRNEAAQLAQVYMRSGTQQGVETAMRLRDNINQLDAGLLQVRQQVEQKQTYLQGMQGLRELATANDPRRLSGVLTQLMGAPIGIQPRPDGNYNYFVNGKKVQDGVAPGQLAAMALKEFSPEARTASAQSAQLENELALKRKYGDAMVNAMRDIQKAMVDGEYKIAEERAKQLQGKLTVDTSKGVAYFQQGNRVFVINPDGKVEETPLGKIELPPTARPVAGLNMGR